MSKETNIKELQDKINEFNIIVNELSNNIGYQKLVSFWKEEVRGLDDTWQFIPEESSKQRMEARATKMAYMHLFSILDYLKQDIINTTRLIEELKEGEDNKE